MEISQNEIICEQIEQFQRGPNKIVCGNLAWYETTNFSYFFDGTLMEVYKNHIHTRIVG